MRYLGLSLGLHLLFGLGLVVSGLQWSQPHSTVNETLEVEWVEVNPTAPASSWAQTSRAIKKKKIQTEKAAETPPSSKESLTPSQMNENTDSAHQARTYAEELKSYIESNRIYPRQALKLQQSGTVMVKLQIAPTGEFRNIDILEPSPFETLNHAAINLLKNLKGFKPPPEELKTAESFVVPIVYQIREKRSL